MWESLTTLSVGGGRFCSELWLSKNNLVGTLPFESSWVALTNLVVLEAAHNEGLGGKLPKLGQAPRLCILDLTSCSIGGELPNSWPVNLQRLLLANNHIKGLIPRWNLPRLRMLSLKGNRLTGLRTEAAHGAAATTTNERVPSRLKSRLSMAMKANKALGAISAAAADENKLTAAEIEGAAAEAAKALAVFGAMPALEHLELDENSIR